MIKNNNKKNTKNNNKMEYNIEYNSDFNVNYPEQNEINYLSNEINNLCKKNISKYTLYIKKDNKRSLQKLFFSNNEEEVLFRMNIGLSMIVLYCILSFIYYLIYIM